jgi:hypothetical protein
VARLQTQVVYIPLELPLDSARHAPGTARGYNFSYFNAEWITNMELNMERNMDNE